MRPYLLYPSSAVIISIVILVVDDSQAILAVARRALEAAGHDVMTASGGGEAVDLAHPDLLAVVVDYDLPGLNGLEVLRHFRESHPSAVRLLISGGLSLETVMDAVNRGEISRVLAKPFSGDQLVAFVKEALDMRERVASGYLASVDAEASRERRNLRECLDQERLQLALQPIVRAADHAIVAHEALLRSNHSVLKSPLQVLRAAERHAMIGAVAEVVARLAKEHLEALEPAHRLFLNLHPLELADPDALAARLGLISTHAHRVTIEITERSKMDEVAVWEASTAAMRRFGFALAVDDLGAGYSSLAALALLSPEYIKIDMSIVRDLHKSLRKRRLVELVCTFADATEATVVAEGIECREEAQVAAECGVHLLQGYFFGKPILSSG